MDEKEKKPYCFMCGRSDKTLIRGKYGIICTDCVKISAKKVQERDSKLEKIKLSKNMKPSVLKSILDDYVIKQDIPKKKIAVAIYNQHKAIQRLKTGYTNVKIKKSGVFLIGPTGSGKTLLIKTLADKLGIPFTVVSATTLTESGYLNII